MNVITKATEQFEKQIHGSGCEDSPVLFKRDTDAAMCQYESGVNLAVKFGGSTSHVVTPAPIEALTKIPFMFGTALNSPQKRSAACGILNVVLGFLCRTRTTNACDPSCHNECKQKLESRLRGKKVFCAGNGNGFRRMEGVIFVDTPDEADCILITCDGLVTDDGVALAEKYQDKTELLFTGPSIAGTAIMQQLPHFCPFGKNKP